MWADDYGGPARMLPDDGGPAFPIRMTDDTTALGATLRDLFAAHAVAGIVSTVDFEKPFDPSVCAETAYLLADAMLRARVK